MLERTLGEMLRRYDKGGEQFYDSDLGAAQGGARLRPRRIVVLAGCACSTAASIRATSARRVIRMASEDIGLADPRALRMALDAAEVYERLGSPEGELALAAGGGLS